MMTMKTILFIALLTVTCSNDIIAQDTLLVVKVKDFHFQPAQGATIGILQNDSIVKLGYTNSGGIDTLELSIDGAFEIKIKLSPDKILLHQDPLQPGINTIHVTLPHDRNSYTHAFHEIPNQSNYGETAGILQGSALDLLLTNKWFRNE